MVTWRTASPDSEAALLLLDHYFESRAAGFPAAMGTYRPTFPRAVDFEPPAGEFLVVEGENLSGEPADVGCGGVRRIDPSATGAVRFEVKHVWLEPFARGGGVGRALLVELEYRAIGLGAEEIVLDTNESLVAAGALYRSSGYESIAPYNENPNATTWYRKTVGPSTAG